MKIRKNILFWIILSLLILVLDGISAWGPLKVPLQNRAFLIKQPIFRLKTGISIWTNLVKRLPLAEKLEAERDKYQKENNDLIFQNKMLTTENETLRKQLGVSNVSAYKYIPSHVLSVSRLMDLGIGEKEGVKVGMPVVSGSVLIGKIKETAQNRSQVLLLTDADIKISAKTLRGTYGVVTGQFGDNIIFGEILQKDPLLLGDEVLTDGTDGLPANLLIGKVIYIKSDDVSVYKQAKVEYALDIRKLDMVFVVSEGI